MSQTRRPPARKEPAEDNLPDLLIVGAGTAGLACATEAAEHGARVLLVEKSGDIGGTLHVSGGHMSAAGTKRQRERGIEDSVESHAADVERISGGTARKDLVRLAVDRAAETVDWLDENGFEFHERSPRIVYGHEPYSVARTYYGTDEARSILEVLRRLVQPHLDSGRVELWLRSPVRGLSVENGTVVGVEVERGGAVEKVGARAVVLTTGGYGSNPGLFRELEGRPLYTAARPTSTGDGIFMGREVGARVVGEGNFIPTFGGLPGEEPGRIDWPARPLLVATERTPWEIYVDRRGDRFMAEDEESIDAKERALMGLDDLTFFTVFDDRALEESQPVVAGWSADDVRRHAGTRPGIFAAESIEGLAGRAGIDPAGLAETVSGYNDAVARGTDPDFGREAFPAPLEVPPFYAMRNHGTTLITFAGLDVDGELRVLSEDGGVVHGLYAAGEVIGASATSGNSFCGGMMITPALTFGRLLGRRLAEAARTAGRSAG